MQLLLGIVITAVAAMVVLRIRREFVLAPLLIILVLLPIGNRLVIGGIDFPMFRFLLGAFILRLLITRDGTPIQLNAVDKLLLVWSCWSVISYTLLWMAVSALINRMGVIVVDCVLVYFIARCYLASWEDVERVIRILGWTTLLLAAAVLVELKTERNPFFALESAFPNLVYREGRARCMASFGHPISLGSFGGVMVPLVISLIQAGSVSKKVGVTFLVSCLFIVFSSGSSGPIVTAVVGGCAACLWTFRRYAKYVRRGLVVALILLALVMNAPVWYIIARIKIIGSSTAYHRSLLIDTFVNHFSDWWLIGVQSTSEWGHQMFDLTNYFLRIAADGGLLLLLLFIAILAVGFKAIGRIVGSNAGPQEKIAWGLGSCLLAHVATFYGLSYWDQIKMLFFLHLSLIGGLYQFHAAGTLHDAPEEGKIELPLESQTKVF